MTQFSTDINVVIRDREFRIDITGDVDRDGCAENIEMFCLFCTVQKCWRNGMANY